MSLPDDSENNNATTYTWTIKNFEICHYNWGKPLKSPEFSIFSCQMPKFHLMLYPKGINEKSSNHVSLYLVKSNDAGEVQHTYFCELGIITCKDKTTCLRFTSRLEQENGRGVATFIDRDKLLSTDRHLMIPDGNLTVFCKISMSENKSSMNDKIHSQLKEFSNELAKIYESGEHSDAVLKAEEKTFKIHKAILKARFPDLLKGMKNNTCEIKGIGRITMNALLRYVYSGVLNLSYVDLFEVLTSNYKMPFHLKSLILGKSNKITAETSFEKKVVSFSWCIQNFSKLEPGTILRYSLIGDDSQFWTWLTIFLGVPSNDKNEDEVAIWFSVNCKKLICTVKTSNITKSFKYIFEKDNKVTLPVFLKKNALIKKSTATFGDEVNFDFEIAMTDGSKTDKIINKELFRCVDSVPQVAEDLMSFQNDLRNLFNDPEFSDITLVSRNNRFPAHKFILSARSASFSEILRLQTEDHRITVDDLDFHVMKGMLEYIYCNENMCSVANPKHVIGLYKAANCYNLPSLKEKCRNQLKLSIQAETAGDILISADKWNDDDLKESVYEFVCLYPKKIADAKEWEEIMLKRNDLALEVLNRTLAHLATEKTKDKNT